MNSGRGSADRLAALGERIRAARGEDARRRPTARGPRSDLSLAAIAWRMITDLLAGILVGFGLGWAVDSLLGTTPWFLIGLGLLGVAGGIRLSMRTAREVDGDGDRG